VAAGEEGLALADRALEAADALGAVGGGRLADVKGVAGGVELLKVDGAGGAGNDDTEVGGDGGGEAGEDSDGGELHFDCW